MNTTTEVKPALYCGTYGKYNNGSIEGKWLYLEDYSDSEEFFKACAELHKNEHDPEFMFQDFEGFPKEYYSESMSTIDMDKLMEWVHMDDEDKELIEEYLDATGYSLDDIELDNVRDELFCTLDYTHSADDNNAMGDYVVDNGLIEIPPHLQSYIDYEAIGRDWLADMSVSGNGFVFTNN
jgi:antirestriction protein